LVVGASVDDVGGSRGSVSELQSTMLLIYLIDMKATHFMKNSSTASVTRSNRSSTTEVGVGNLVEEDAAEVDLK